MSKSPPQLRTLGLDPSVRNYGWALVEGPTLVEKGTEKTKPKHFDHEVHGYVHHRNYLSALISRLKPDKISIESPTFGQVWSEGQYTLFMYSIEAIWDAQVDFVYLSNSATKAWVRRYLDAPTGFDIGKAEMISASKRHSGVTGRWSSHEADAYIAAVLGGRFWSYLGGSLLESDLTEYEKNKFDEVYTPTRGKKAGLPEKKGLRFKEGQRWFTF